MKKVNSLTQREIDDILNRISKMEDSVENVLVSYGGEDLVYNEVSKIADHIYAIKILLKEE